MHEAMYRIAAVVVRQEAEAVHVSHTNGDLVQHFCNIILSFFSVQIRVQNHGHDHGRVSECK